jgi:hypothetical protein
MFTENFEKARRRLVRKKGLLKVVPVSPRTLNSLMAKDLIPYRKLGAIVLFDVDEVLAALDTFKRKVRKH